MRPTSLTALLAGGALTLTLSLALASFPSGPAPMAHAAGGEAAPCMPSGSRTPGVHPIFEFGRDGGNIRPTRVSVFGDGAIRYQGVTPIITTYRIHPAAVLGLERLAQAEGFNTMPQLIRESHWLPDVGTLYVSIYQGCDATARTVRAQGTVASPAFTELFYTLSAATGLQI